MTNRLTIVAIVVFVAAPLVADDAQKKTDLYTAALKRIDALEKEVALYKGECADHLEQLEALQKHIIMLQNREEYKKYVDERIRTMLLEQREKEGEVLRERRSIWQKRGEGPDLRHIYGDIKLWWTNTTARRAADKR